MDVHVDVDWPNAISAFAAAAAAASAFLSLRQAAKAW